MEKLPVIYDEELVALPINANDALASNALRQNPMALILFVYRSHAGLIETEKLPPRQSVEDASCKGFPDTAYAPNSATQFALFPRSNRCERATKQGLPLALSGIETVQDQVPRRLLPMRAVGMKGERAKAVPA